MHLSAPLAPPVLSYVPFGAARTSPLSYVAFGAAGLAMYLSAPPEPGPKLKERYILKNFGFLVSAAFSRFSA